MSPDGAVCACRRSAPSSRTLTGPSASAGPVSGPTPGLYPGPALAPRIVCPPPAPHPFPGPTLAMSTADRLHSSPTPQTPLAPH